MGIAAEPGATGEELLAALRARRCRPLAFGSEGSRFLHGPAGAPPGPRRAPASRAPGGKKSPAGPRFRGERVENELVRRRKNYVPSDVHYRELFKILQEIKRRRIWVVVVVVISALVGFLLASEPGLPPHSRQCQQAIASADILIETRNSQVVDVGGQVPSSRPWPAAPTCSVT